MLLRYHGSWTVDWGNLATAFALPAASRGCRWCRAVHGGFLGGMCAVPDKQDNRSKVSSCLVYTRPRVTSLSDPTTFSARAVRFTATVSVSTILSGSSWTSVPHLLPQYSAEAAHRVIGRPFVGLSSTRTQLIAAVPHAKRRRLLRLLVRCHVCRWGLHESPLLLSATCRALRAGAAAQPTPLRSTTALRSFVLLRPHYVPAKSGRLCNAGWVPRSSLTAPL